MIHYYFIQNRSIYKFISSMLSSLFFIPIVGILALWISTEKEFSSTTIKYIALTTSIVNFIISLVMFMMYDFSTNQFQFVKEYYDIRYFDFQMGVDGLSVYFIILTTLIIPVSLVSNWKSITKQEKSYVIILLLLEILLLAVFLVLDLLFFYIYFESILPPLFLLIGMFGSHNRVKASFYLFLYTLLGSLFLLLSILGMLSIVGTIGFSALFKGNFVYLTQLFLFYGIFIAFAVKTPTIFLNTWLLKAHVESPLGGSIILAAIVLKLSLYGIVRLILPILPKAYMEYTYVIFLIGIITIVYASLSTLRTIDIKELIAYSSVSHASVYLSGVFSNCIQGIEGAINLGLGHGLVSPGLFISAGGVLYDRSSTRVISFYKGVTQVMPLFAILFFILCLANCGAPLSLNFIGEFLSLYGVFERSPLLGVFASSSIIFSAGYTIYMYQRIAFGGSYTKMFKSNMPDLTQREFTILMVLVIPTIFFGIFPSPLLDPIHYSVSSLLYSSDISNCDIDNYSTVSIYVTNYISECNPVLCWLAIYLFVVPLALCLIILVTKSPLDSVIYTYNIKQSGFSSLFGSCVKFIQKKYPNILIIFIVGLIGRHLVNNISGINVTTDYFHPISLIYFMVFAPFVVFIKELHFNWTINNLIKFTKNIIAVLRSNFSSPIRTSLKEFFEYFKIWCDITMVHQHMYSGQWEGINHKTTVNKTHYAMYDPIRDSMLSNQTSAPANPQPGNTSSKPEPGITPSNPNIIQYKGFWYDHTTRLYKVIDPHNIAIRGYNPNGGNQPYAKFLGDTIEEILNTNSEHFKGRLKELLDQEDLNYWNSFCDVYNNPQNPRSMQQNSFSRKKVDALKKSP